MPDSSWARPCGTQRDTVVNMANFASRLEAANKDPAVASSSRTSMPRRGTDPARAGRPREAGLHATRRCSKC
jgi:hypothetical protein